MDWLMKVSGSSFFFLHVFIFDLNCCTIACDNSLKIFFWSRLGVGTLEGLFFSLILKLFSHLLVFF